MQPLAIEVRPSDIEVKQSPHGRGVFALRPFKQGDIIEDCPTLEVSEDDVDGALLDYVFVSNEDDTKRLLLLGYGMLYNHGGPNANVEHTYWDDTPGIMGIVALRDIDKGEELRIDYGDEWWAERDETPEV